ncbi:hypothetical protein FEM48_Zijuj04G0180400 [Ziziphus jujuba var. spinosa]|uniref:Uncharacterized protein n=1 Tax=Ziziphus jujuba var. spinosa TaxID=714518 RepID=A0A978VLC9_ZIZJJ|nr:uncharacterized protein LOC107417114 [Ziziphus jujuba var. spinosa]KAH7533898.1 hypothetical protein FEM48_Zijuj04G0180400 [Ziziphus jujuba var. spinosa]
MASSLPCFCAAIKLKSSLKLNKTYGSVQARAQSFRDEERYSSNMVDENMKILRERMEVVRKKEKLERCCRGQVGWNYSKCYDYKVKRDKQLVKMVEVAGVIGGSLGFTFFTGILFLCLVSLLVHFNQIISF